MELNYPNEVIFKRYKDTDYYVSVNGMVFSMITNKILSGYRCKNGYMWFYFYTNKKSVSISVHRLIAECYIDNPHGHPIVRHLDDNPYNNDLSNLVWGTKSENMYDAIRNGRLLNRPSPSGEKNSRARLTSEVVLAIRKDANNGANYSYIALKYGISVSYVYNIIQKRVWKHI